jgi:hypothetical protein
VHSYRIVSPLVVLLTCALSVWAEDLSTYRREYDESLEEIVLAHGAELKKLGRRYRAALEALKRTVQQTGDLNKTKAVIAEIDRWDLVQVVPARPSPQAITDVGRLQVSYHKQRASLEVDRAKKHRALIAQYDWVLEQLQKELTKEGKLERATAVQQERQKLEKIALAEKTKSIGVSAPATDTPHARIKNIKGVEGIFPLANGTRAFANRRYVWINIPEDLPAKRFARTYGSGGNITISVVEPGQGYIAILVSPEAEDYLARNGWTRTKYVFNYTDPTGSSVEVYTRLLAKGTLKLPRLSFTGPIVLLP